MTVEVKTTMGDPDRLGHSVLVRPTIMADYLRLLGCRRLRASQTIGALVSLDTAVPGRKGQRGVHGRGFDGGEENVRANEPFQRLGPWCQGEQPSPENIHQLVHFPSVKREKLKEYVGLLALDDFA